MKLIDYKFNEDALISELREYVDSTYSAHYSRNKFQATEFIIDGGHGEGFCIGNIMKYAQRYGNKDGYNRKDLLKVLHYALIALYVHDKEHPVIRDILDEYDDLMAGATLTFPAASQTVDIPLSESITLSGNNYFSTFDLTDRGLYDNMNLSISDTTKEKNS